MSEVAKGESPTDAQRHLLPFGVGGDYIGARRARRSFRLMVLACVGLTISLYFAEHYLRYGLSEVQYRMALTLEDDSQRAILRNVVKRDAGESEAPSPRYVAALAYIEEDDLVLERYAEAVDLAPDDGALLIVYGAKLFQMGEFKEARRIFREAGLKSSGNALPDYLQAAAIAASSPSEEDFRTAVALVARTNDSGEPLVFPQPLWHESLPRRGYWYARLRRELADLCCAPLYALENAIVKRVHGELREGSAPDAGAWLYQLQMIGEQLVGEESDAQEQRSTSVLIAGIKLQQDAVALRQQIAEGEKGHPDENLNALATRLSDAMTRVVQFESQRDQSFPRRERGAELPVHMALSGMVFLGFASFLLILLNRIFRTDKNARALRQPSLGMRVMGVWLAALFLCLIWAASGFAEEFGTIIVFWLWIFLLAAIVVMAIIYPAFILPSATTVCSRFLTEPRYNERFSEARRVRRKAYLSLSSRFASIALGLYLCLLCACLVGFRVFTGLYPTDLKFLISGLSLEEFALIQELQSLL